MLTAHHDRIQAWLDDGVTAVKVGELLGREGIVAPERMLHRYALAECGHGHRPKTTLRVADGEPGDELQVEFGRMGLVFDPEAGRNRVCHTVIFTACYSRHCFVWLASARPPAGVLDGFGGRVGLFGGYVGDLVKDQYLVRHHGA